MKRTYQEPQTEVFVIVSEGSICLNYGKAGGDGKPGADFDSSDIFDGGDI